MNFSATVNVFSRIKSKNNIALEQHKGALKIDSAFASLRYKNAQRSQSVDGNNFINAPNSQRKV